MVMVAAAVAVVATVAAVAVPQGQARSSSP